MSFLIQTGEFVQILHSHNHWLTILSTSTGVKVFDSLNDYIPLMTKAQIACLLCTSKNKIEVKIMDVQKQVILTPERQDLANKSHLFNAGWKL